VERLRKQSLLAVNYYVVTDKNFIYLFTQEKLLFLSADTVGKPPSLPAL
jgi:hypothetical protein